MNRLYEAKIDRLLVKIAPASLATKQQAVRHALPQAYFHMKNIRLNDPYAVRVAEKIEALSSEYLSRNLKVRVQDLGIRTIALDQGKNPSHSLESYLKNPESSKARLIEGVYLKTLKDLLGDAKFDAIFSHGELALKVSASNFSDSPTPLGYFTSIASSSRPFMRISADHSYFLYNPKLALHKNEASSQVLLDCMEADYISEDMIKYLEEQSLESIQDKFFPYRLYSRSLEFTFRDYILFNMKD